MDEQTPPPPDLGTARVPRHGGRSTRTAASLVTHLGAAGVAVAAYDSGGSRTAVEASAHWTAPLRSTPDLVVC
jgi:hypothetical protein